MYHYLQIIALHGMRGKKRSMLYMVLVLFLSMVFVVVNVSISGSLAKTQEQLRLDTYGDWDVALFSRGNLADSTKLTDERILDYGTAGIYGSLLDEGGTLVTCLGTPDDKLWELGHLSVESGRFPRKADEIAMEADVLSQLGYDYQLGQTVKLQLWDQREDAHGARAEGSVTTREYVLCGILREYTDLWVSEWGRLAGAVLSPAGAEALGRPVSYQYFVKVSDEDSMNAARLCRLWNGEETCEALENAAASGRQQSAEYHLFNLVLILFTTIAAVVSIYSIQLKEQERLRQIHAAVCAQRD